MSFPVPTLGEIDGRMLAELPVNAESPALRRNLYVPLAGATAGAVHSVWGYLQWVARQIHPQHCDDDVLENNFAGFWLPQGRKAASFARGTIRVFGNAGSGITREARWTCNELEYAPIAEAIIPEAGSLDLDVVCLTAGQSGNLTAGARMVLANPIDGVQREALVLEPGISGGADLEDIEALRQRVLDARAAGGETGRASDWELWAREREGVTRAWCVPHWVGFGTCVVFFVRDGDDDIFPNEDEQAALTDYLRAEGTPFGEVYATAPVRRRIDITLQLSPDTPTVREAARAALRSAINAQAAPLNVRARDLGQTKGVTIVRSHLTEALSSTTGEEDHTLIAPAANIVCAVGELAELGEITWA